MSHQFRLGDLLRPDPEVRKRNHAFLELVLGPDDSANNLVAKHWQRANELLDVDTGNWGDRMHVWHHCDGFLCCPGGIKQTRMRIWMAILVPCL